MNISDKSPIIYFDMDGVLSDFNSSYKILKKVYKSRHETLKSINQPIFWESLKPIKKGFSLLKIISNQNYKLEIMTMALAQNKEPSIKGKKKWLKMYGLDHIPLNFATIKRPNKNHKDIVQILIDDHPLNLSTFEKYGGISILFNKHRTIDQIVTELDYKIKNHF